MLRRLVLLVLDIWRVASRVLRRLLLLDKPRCWLASRKAVSSLVISDFRPCSNPDTPHHRQFMAMKHGNEAYALR